MSPSLPLAAALIVAAVSAAAPAVPSTALGRPRYDANDQGLRVPYLGGVPTWTRGSLKQPPRIFLDFDAPSRLTGVISEGVPNHPVWLSWAMAPRDRTKTRLTLVFRRDTTVAVRVDRERGVLMIVPRIPAPDGNLRPVPGPTPLEEPLPNFPEETTPTISPTPRRALSTPPPVPTPRPTMTPWIPPRPTATPWVTPVATPSPSPTPTPAPLPSDVYLPGSPEPRETPALVATPAPTPLAPVPTPRQGGVDHMVSTAVAYGAYEEVPVGTAVAARADNQRIVGARLQSRVWPAGRDRVLADGWLPWWGFGLDLYGTNVAYTDPMVASALHARQEWRSHLALTRGVRLSPLELQGGLGLQARYENLWSAGTPAAAGATATGWRAILAPELIVAGRLPLAGTLEVYGDGAMAPFATAWQPAAVAAAPSLGGTRFELGLAGSWSGLRLAVGYRRWSLNGAGYGETFQGPVLTLGGWLAPDGER